MDIITSLFLNYVVLFLVVVASSVVLYFGVRWVIKNAKLIACCTLAIGLFLAAIVIIPQLARAEELPEDLYYKVVFVDEVEELEEELLLHGDDADHLWTWYEEYPSEDEEFISFEFDKELSNLALRWAQENGFFVQLDKEERIVRGRIVVLTMRYSDDPNGDEVIDSYFTEFVTR